MFTGGASTNCRRFRRRIGSQTRELLVSRGSVEMTSLASFHNIRRRDESFDYFLVISPKSLLKGDPPIWGKAGKTSTELESFDHDREVFGAVAGGVDGGVEALGDVGERQRGADLAGRLLDQVQVLHE